MKRVLYWLALAQAAGCANNIGEGEGEAESEGEPECTPGDSECSDDDHVLFCSAEGAWIDEGLCAKGMFCEVGACKTPAACPTPGFRDCMENTVVECNADQTGWNIVEECSEGEGCQGGSCAGLCDLAQSNNSFIACEFFAYSLDNPDLSYYPFSLVAANPGEEAAVVTVESRTGDTWSVASMFTVPAGSNGYTELPKKNVLDSALTPGAAYRARSTVPVLMYELNGYPWLSIGGGSAGATLLYPTAALGRQYYGMTLEQGNGGYRAHLVIIGTEDNTNVTVRVSETGNVLEGTDVPAIGSTATENFTLNEGDVLQLASAEAEDDLTGTYIEGDKDIMVYGAHADSPVTYDHFEEQLPSIDKWGTEFVAAKIVGTENPSAEPIWRIVASEDDTLLTFEAGTGTTGMPSGPVQLDAGEWYETRANGHFHVTSTDVLGDPEEERPVLMAQWVTADIDMVIVPPIKQYLPEYVFTNFAGGEVTGTLTVARPAGTEVTLDGSPWIATWTDAGGGWEVAQTGNPTGNHIISLGGTPDPDAAIEIWIRGNGGGCTFSYVGGYNFLDLNPID